MQTEMVWAHFSPIWPCQDHHAGYRRWRQKERERQKKRWEDNIREWTGLELRNTLRIAEDRKEWKAVVRRSPTAPQLVSNLRDRCKNSQEKPNKCSHCTASRDHEEEVRHTEALGGWIARD
ncbi:hypothetical protein ElyMa_005405600 [Elysia marginata]|uniref:Uncharacterized protein n=1 Tax=Elysia marginata TaxID=1093978 RepID=A0AAV4EH74_9GAST|nr:hypothetical protein ElyMa_005405600 [Elysia marginata]